MELFEGRTVRGFSSAALLLLPSLAAAGLVPGAVHFSMKEYLVFGAKERTWKKDEEGTNMQSYHIVLL